MKTHVKDQKKRKVVGFRVRENECIWMKAGVVNFHICDNAYDCNSCKFDKAMQKALAAGNKAGPDWTEVLRNQPDAESRICRHVLTGRAEPGKLCTNNYECNHCAFDQWLEETDVYAAGAPAFREAAGYRVADDYYYHMGHGWARVEHGGYIRMGFDDFAVKVFGKANRVEVPRLGATVAQNRPGWAFGRDGNTAEMLSPVTGTVLAVNQRALDYPEIIHDRPYQDGWVLLVGPKNLKQCVKKLYFSEEAVQWMEDEGRELMRLMGPEYEQLAATGGQALDDFYGFYPDIGWDTLVRSFLRT